MPSPHQTLKQLPETYTTATLSAKQLPETFAAKDCKPLFDLASRTAMPRCAEFRTQLAAKAIKDLLNENVSLRWVHSGAQLADALTKIMENSFLGETLRIGHYKLHDELEVLRNCASARNRLRWLRGQAHDRSSNTCSEGPDFSTVRLRRALVGGSGWFP